MGVSVRVSVGVGAGVGAGVDVGVGASVGAGVGAGAGGWPHARHTPAHARPCPPIPPAGQLEPCQLPRYVPEARSRGGGRT